MGLGGSRREEVGVVTTAGVATPGFMFERESRDGPCDREVAAPGSMEGREGSDGLSRSGRRTEQVAAR